MRKNYIWVPAILVLIFASSAIAAEGLSLGEGPTPWLQEVACGYKLQAASAVYSTEAGYISTFSQQQQSRVWRYESSHHPIAMQIEIVPEPPHAVRYRTAYHNTGTTDQILDRIIPLKAVRPAPKGVGKVMPNSYQVGYLSDSEKIYTPTPGNRYDSSYWTLAVEEPPTTMGYLQSVHQVGRWVLQSSTDSVLLESYGDCDSVILPAGKTRFSDWMFISSAPNTLAELERYGELAAAFNQAQVWPENFAIWCSWYSGWIGRQRQQYLKTWRGGLENGVYQQIPLIGELFGSRNANFMRVVDDSAEMPMGDWSDASPIIPGGFDKIIKTMDDNQVQAGYWFSPFTVSDQSELYQQHPDWFATDENGEIFHHGFYGNNAVLLDSSIPAVQTHLTNLAARLSAKGFKYVMTDFLIRQLNAPRFADRTLTHLEVHRLGLEALARGFAPEVYWLGCTALPGPCMGLVDGLRISGDSFGGFGREAYAYAQSGMRWFYHRRLWLNDPDSIITRGHWNFQEREYQREDKGIEFNQGWMSWIALAGTPMTYGDTFDDLPEDNIALYKKIFPPVNQAGRPLDLWENNPHHLWGISLEGPGLPTTLFGAFNYFATSTIQLTINLDEVYQRCHGFDYQGSVPSRYLVWDFWNEQLIATEPAQFDLAVPPQRGSLFCLRENLGRPQLIATTGHFSQGAQEVSDVGWETISGEQHLWRASVKGNGGDSTRLYLYVPEGYRLESVQLEKQPLSAISNQPGVAALDIPASDTPLQIEIVFQGNGQTIPDRPKNSQPIAICDKVQ